MNSKQVISSILTAAMFVSSFGCSAKKTETPKGSDIKEFTGFFCARNEPLDADNEIRSLIAEKTGCILYEEWIDDQDNLDKLFSDMIIANKYPDFLSPDAENCQKLIKEGALIPIDNYWDAYPNLKELCSEDEWDRVRAADGHIYYMPLFSSVYQKDTNTTHEGEAFWVQLKVLKWANYPQLKTLDDYFGLIEDYLEANPTDDNGEPYIGYEIQANDAWFFALDNPPMFLDGHPNDGCCYVDPDTLEAKDYNMLPTAKAWYKKLNEEYQKGVVDQHCFVMSSEEYYSTLASGRVLGMVDQHWNFNSSTR
ncbi:MAG: sugar ABC transporter substrate-binding protein, partial [Ruminococcus sp.]|nr:sugar ABC transporter substrate-binding protein [Ruminococcus sp.]